MFWNLWCEKVKFLSPESGSSHSETSAATSSTASTLYLVDSKQVVKPNGLAQVWCKFGTGKAQSAPGPKWTDRYLYLGKSFDDRASAYRPVMDPPRISQFVRPRKLSHFSVNGNRPSRTDEVHIGDSYHINRFGSGIREGCTSALFLPAEDYIVPRRFSQTSGQSSAMYDDLQLSHHVLDTMEVMAEDGVRLWECNYDRNKRRHRRRYGFAPQPLFLYGLGPWNINPGAKYSIQVKRAVSVVTIRRQPVEAELRLPVTKRQLVATISCETLHHDKAKVNTQLTCGYVAVLKGISVKREFDRGPRRPVVFFWTPDYWYRPRSAKDAYQELQTHLTKINQYHQKTKRRRRLFRRRAPPRVESSESESDSSDQRSKYRKSKKRKSMVRFNMFGGKSRDVCDMALCCMVSTTDQEKAAKETSLQYLKRLLKVDVALSAWDFNSTTLAQQLTMVDRDLFLKISGIELGVLVSQQSSKNAPNVAAMVAFAHRISCLVASDILKNQSERMRARLIARFVTVAEKCHRISNFHSCRTVLFGLQSPAIYRLKATWAYVRKKHASKYQTFEFLCRLYRDPRLLDYQKTFFLSSQTTPYLPFVGDIVAKLLDRIPNYVIVKNKKSEAELKGLGAPCKDTSLFTKLLMSMKLVNFQNSSLSGSKMNERAGRKGLCDYFKPLDCYEDNRFKCLVETTEFLQQCQLSALHYSFMPNNLATDYLLKARYSEERDNFFQSFRVESVDCTED
ncbi:uncharacterized protein [Tenebrio molitor]|uniref:uncharacterized protein n=1 Tax=Tenebrio molitor TaxID=7067 RepID=UPI00362475A9